MKPEDWTVLFACICWPLWCLGLTRLLDQEPRSDYFATLIGLAVIVIGLAE